MDSPNKLIVITAPSGSGKTTIVKRILERYDNLEFSVSATTRKRRDGEVHGKDYYFLSPETFAEWQADGAFIETEEVYEGLFYGTPRFEVERIWEQGKHVVFDIDVKGAMRIKQAFPQDAKVIFIRVPDIQELEKRLRARKTESAESLARRLNRIAEEMRYADDCDFIVDNIVLEDAVEHASEVISGILNESSANEQWKH